MGIVGVSTCATIWFGQRPASLGSTSGTAGATKPVGFALTRNATGPWVEVRLGKEGVEVVVGRRGVKRGQEGSRGVKRGGEEFRVGLLFLAVLLSVFFFPVTGRLYDNMVLPKEAIDPHTMRRALMEIHQCDVLVVLGTSLR